MTVNYLAVDPGKTTGWATRCDGVIDSGQTGDKLEFLTDTWHQLERESGWVVVVERYTIGSETVKKSRQHDPLEIIGALRWLAHVHGHDFVEQAPADAKRFCPDARLRQLGLWVPGQDHARDALRHLVLRLAKDGELPLSPL